jgi:hypothetical protein
VVFAISGLVLVEHRTQVDNPVELRIVNQIRFNTACFSVSPCTRAWWAMPAALAEPTTGARAVTSLSKAVDHLRGAGAVQLRPLDREAPEVGACVTEQPCRMQKIVDYDGSHHVELELPVSAGKRNGASSPITCLQTITIASH